MSIATPSREAILNLYHNMLKTSQSFSSYNFRQYFTRRTRDTFRVLQNENNPERIRSLYSEAIREHKVLQRSAVINQLHGGWRVTLEVQEAEKQAEEILRQRSDS